tara:strand:+ start:1051 stop:3225 length:2175 start_codon:yes stop_codon:yes gene_type:complete
MKKQIIVTLGPASFDERIVKRMTRSGADYFRINLSHTEVKDYKKIINRVSEWTDKPVCPDTEGAQLRTGKINNKNKFIELTENQKVCFVSDNGKHKENEIPIANFSPMKIFQIGDLMKIDFDSVLIHITKKLNNRIFGKVLESGIIRSNKGIALDREVHLPCFTEKDKEILKISNELKIETVFLSFCSKSSDIVSLRNFFNYPVKVIAKVESKEGLLNLIDISKEADGILIDRGDLSRDIPLEKIPFAQEKILSEVKPSGTPVYVATNLMENMISNSKPTRAEINDIVTSLNSGAQGLVLAAETAIGKYPIECVRILSRIIHEIDAGDLRDNQYLFSLPSDRVIEPHGGKLVEQYISKENVDYKNIPIIAINKNVLSDVNQITTGVYSPIKSFMNLDETMLVLEKHSLFDDNAWTLPILLQINNEQKKQINNNSIIGLANNSKDLIAILKIDKIEQINQFDKICKLWFGTDDINHPGVAMFLKGGDYILSGRPYLIQEDKTRSISLTPAQTRDIFNHKGWHDIIGFHTRNIIHRGHGFIQKKALKQTDADGIYISPVIGAKKTGDFKSKMILKAYEILISENFYKPYGVLVNPFNTYSRYSGPREAIFTALCRKNFGCNHFIIGRDHTGVGNYYDKDASIKIFNQIDIDMNILPFETVFYSDSKKEITDKYNLEEDSNLLPLSGTIIREQLRSNGIVSDYILEKSIKDLIEASFSNNPDDLFVK